MSKRKLRNRYLALRVKEIVAGCVKLHRQGKHVWFVQIIG